MPNLDIIFDVTIAVTWDEIKTLTGNLSLPSFVTFDASYFCLWPKTLRFERYGKKSPSNRPSCPETS